MFLSRLILNPRNGRVRRDLADCGQMHRTIMRAFPPTEPGESARASLGVLYRVDADPQGRLVLYVQSRQCPDWSALEPGYLLHPPACRRVDHVYQALTPGTVLRFRLRANPTRKIDTKSGADGRRRHGRRVELRTEADRLAWLERKAEASGFELVSVRVSTSVPDVTTIPQGKVVRTSGYCHCDTPEGRISHTLTLAPVLFEGHLRVVEAERFRRALETGIGPGKAYGMGLLSIAPAAR